MAERSADWLDQALGDLEHALLSLEGAHFDWACFSAQQAAEKAAKAVLQRRGVEVFGHSVVDLLRLVDGAPAGLDEAALRLDRAYIAARYPDAHPSGSPRRRYTRREAMMTVADAERVVRFLEGILSQPHP